MDTKNDIYKKVIISPGPGGWGGPLIISPNEKRNGEKIKMMT